MFKAFLRSHWLRPFNDPSVWQSLARLVNRQYAGRNVGARIVAIREETYRCKTFTLALNKSWPGRDSNALLQRYQAGMHIVVKIAVKGRNLIRTFSVSSIDKSKHQLSITVQQSARQARPGDPLVSTHLLTQAKLGDSLEIIDLAGNFTIDSNNKKTLFITAGSGITPIMAMLREGFASNSESRDLVHVHLCKSADDLIFAEQLQSWNSNLAGYRLLVHFSASNGRLSATQLLKLCPDLATRAAYICGPNALTQALCQQLSAFGVSHIKHESFGGVSTNVGSGQQVSMLLNKTKQLFTISSQTNLLNALEAQGLQPKFGCRIGVCLSCQCLKLSGRVQDLRTGQFSDAPNQLIQLCSTSASSDIALNI